MESGRAATSPPAAGAPPLRSDLIAEVAARVGSVRQATWIVEHAVSTTDPVTAPTATGPGSVRRTALELADRRAAGEPLQYVLGSWSFRSLELTVDRRVLIPRPETEQVVEVALRELDRAVGARSDDDVGGIVGVDLGTGTGAIALSLAAEVPRHDRPLEVWATDVSLDALDVAGLNLNRLAAVDQAAADRVTLARGTWFDALPPALAGRVDLVVANPPYVSDEEYTELDPEVREWEPVGALVSAGGSDGSPGLADIETVVSTAPRWLRPTGALVVELAPAQARAAEEAARRAGFARVGTELDLAGRLRILVAGW